MTSPLHKVISGAQIGADIAGLRAAYRCSLETGGWMPKGWKTKLGMLDLELVDRYGLEQMPTTNYPDRTRQNVADSDATIQFAYDWDSYGEILTTRLASTQKITPAQIQIVRWGNTFQIADPEEGPSLGIQVVDWILDNKIGTLNVAGNANVAIEACVEEFLMSVFHELEEA